MVQFIASVVAMADMDHQQVRRAALVYLYLKNKHKHRQTRRRTWVHQIDQLRSEFGEFHC